MGFFSKLFDPSAGEIKRLNKIVDKIDSFEEAHKALTDEQLRGKTVEFRERLKNGETLDDLLPEAYSVVREATYRVTGKRQFRVQMLGGIVLHQGRIEDRRGQDPDGNHAGLPQRALRRRRACRDRQRLSGQVPGRGRGPHFPLPRHDRGRDCA